MQRNPYSDDPMDMQPTEQNPPMAPRQSAVPQYQAPQNMPPAYGNAARPAQDVERAARGQENVRTFTFGVAKFNDYLRWILLVLEVIFFLRFILRLLGADPGNPFAAFLYNLTNVFLFMFRGIVTDPAFGTNNANVFEWSTLIGMLVYGLIIWVIMLFLRTTISRPQDPTLR